MFQPGIFETENGSVFDKHFREVLLYVKRREIT